MNGRRLACIGDTTTAGGRVLDGSDHFLIDDIRVALVGSQVLCASCGITRIVGGSPAWYVHDTPVARDGDPLACGHHIRTLGKHGVFDFSDVDDEATGSCPDAGKVSAKQAEQQRGFRADAAAHDGVPHAQGSHVLRLRVCYRDGSPRTGHGYEKRFADGQCAAGKTGTDGLTVHARTTSRLADVILDVPEVEL